MNNNINKIVNFTIAKSLKEKGFDDVTNLIYMINHTAEVLFENINQLRHSDGNNPFCSAPTIADVMGWLYKKHGIWVECYWDTVNIKEENELKWYFAISYIGNIDVDNISSRDLNKEYDSPEDCYEGAFEHILINHLIN